MTANLATASDATVVRPLPPLPHGSRAGMLLAGVLFAVLLLGFYAGVRFFRHIGAAATIHSANGQVDWTVDRSNWFRGGETTVDFAMQFRYLRGQETDPKTLDALPQLINLKSLDLLGFEKLAGKELDVIEGLGSLHTLCLNRMVNLDWKNASGLRLDDTALPHLAKLTGLKTLWLANNDITDEGLAALATLQNLEELDLDGTLITDKAVPHLLKLRKLQILRVGATKMTPAATQELMRQIPGLQVSVEASPELTDLRSQ